MSDFEILEAKMHQDCDTRLGDVIGVKTPPSADFVDLKGYVLDEESPVIGTNLLDPMAQIKRLKILKLWIPAPTRAMRFRSAKLGDGVFQIAGQVDDGGSHYLFDVQKAA